MCIHRPTVSANASGVRHIVFFYSDHLHKFAVFFAAYLCTRVSLYIVTFEVLTRNIKLLSFFCNVDFATSILQLRSVMEMVYNPTRKAVPTQCLKICLQDISHRTDRIRVYTRAH